MRSIRRCLTIIALCLSYRSHPLAASPSTATIALPLYYWQPQYSTMQGHWSNFGDVLSLQIVQRMVDCAITVVPSNHSEKKLLAIGSILHRAQEGDVIWGTGVNGKDASPQLYTFRSLDVRAVRGPLTREFLKLNCHIDCPEIYGDPALLLPRLFPEFQVSAIPEFEYLLILHYLDIPLFKRDGLPHIVYATDPWEEVIKKILKSRLVISSSLHGVIVAEAFGIPARLLRLSTHEPLFKFYDYYHGTQRFSFQWATSIEQALNMGGESPPICDLDKLYRAFPFEYWTHSSH